MLRRAAAASAASTPPPHLTASSSTAKGFECNVLNGGGLLLQRLRPRFFQVELKRPATRTCVEKIATTNSYALGPSVGHDGNTVFYPREDAEPP